MCDVETPLDSAESIAGIDRVGTSKTGSVSLGIRRFSKSRIPGFRTEKEGTLA